MDHQTNAQGTQSSANQSDQKDVNPESPQPESGFIDRDEQMDTRQSSPMNSRVNDKPDQNQEEA